MLGESLADSWRSLVEARLEALLPHPGPAPERLVEAMRYAVVGGGKRIRPLLAMASSLAVGGKPEDAMDVGCACEFVHCFSLIHDDLPAIDDDDLRRGQPTVHRKFDEATAVLAGDALFALGFETVVRAALPTGVRLVCLDQLVAAVGSSGLVGGETMDVHAKGRALGLEEVAQMHAMKTGALFSACCAMGAASGGAGSDLVARVAKAGASVGLAFQIADDCLDATSSVSALGKPVRRDQQADRATYPAVLGLEGAKAEAERLITETLPVLGSFPGEAAPLQALAQACAMRGS